MTCFFFCEAAQEHESPNSCLMANPQCLLVKSTFFRMTNPIIHHIVGSTSPLYYYYIAIVRYFVPVGVVFHLCCWNPYQISVLGVYPDFKHRFQVSDCWWTTPPKKIPQHIPIVSPCKDHVLHSQTHPNIMTIKKKPGDRNIPGNYISNL